MYAWRPGKRVSKSATSAQQPQNNLALVQHSTCVVLKKTELDSTFVGMDVVHEIRCMKAFNEEHKAMLKEYTRLLDELKATILTSARNFLKRMQFYLVNRSSKM
jgi:hypothetical protein